MQCEVRLGHPQKNIKHADGNLVENLGAVLKLMLHNVEVMHVR